MMPEKIIQQRLDFLKKEYLNEKLPLATKMEIYTRITELMGILNYEGTT